MFNIEIFKLGMSRLHFQKLKLRKNWKHSTKVEQILKKKTFWKIDGTQ
jgi:hypothetical protein